VGQYFHMWEPVSQSAPQKLRLRSQSHAANVCKGQAASEGGAHNVTLSRESRTRYKGFVTDGATAGSGGALTIWSSSRQSDSYALCAIPGSRGCVFPLQHGAWASRCIFYIPLPNTFPYCTEPLRARCSACRVDSSRVIYCFYQPGTYGQPN
jgi:hypothetical protein